MSAAPPPRIAPPALLFQLIEGRTLVELAACFGMWPLLAKAPRGDGHPVLVLPGFLATGSSTYPLRQFLKTLGYKGHRWKLGRNLGPVGGKERQILARVHELRERYDQKVSLVGWSLGGIYARELAWMAPEDIRLVITLGTPFAAAGSSRAEGLYRRLAGQRPDELDPALHARIPEPPPVPSTSIYSRTDGIVAWRSSLERQSPTTENIRVQGSHLGLGHNPAVLWAVANRLAQPDGSWAPFERPSCLRLAYPKPDHRPAGD